MTESSFFLFEGKFCTVDIISKSLTILLPTQIWLCHQKYVNFYHIPQVNFLYKFPIFWLKHPWVKIYKVYEDTIWPIFFNNSSYVNSTYPGPLMLITDKSACWAVRHNTSGFRPSSCSQCQFLHTGRFLQEKKTGTFHPHILPSSFSILLHYFLLAFFMSLQRKLVEDPLYRAARPLTFLQK